MWTSFSLLFLLKVYLFIYLNFAGGSPNSHKMGWAVSHWLWRELQRRPELKRASRALTTDILSILWTFTHGNSGIGLTALPNIWTMCVQCLSKTVDHLSWSLSEFVAHKSHVYFYRPQSGVSLEETPKQRHIWLPLRVKQSHLVAQPSASSEAQYAARKKGPLLLSSDPEFPSQAI